MVRILRFLTRIVYLNFRSLCALLNVALVPAPITPSAKSPLILERIRCSTVVTPACLALTV